MRAIMMMLLLTGSSAFAQVPPGRHAIPGAGAFMPMNPSIEASNTALAKLQEQLNTPLTQGADHNFVLRVLQLKQAATALAQVEAKYGADAAVKQQASQIAAAARKDVVSLQAWLDAHPAKQPGLPNVPPGIQYK